MKYEANWKSLDTRPIPAWFDEGKLGIFMHWGLYSVPAFARRRHTVEQTGSAYAEWYGFYARQDDGNAVRAFHDATYQGRKYEDFADAFRAELFDADRVMELIKASGAKHYVLTSKHHDGFCLWPSKFAWNWNSVDVGPHRDIVGEFRSAARRHGIRQGLYYSLFEWSNPYYDAQSGGRGDYEKYVDTHMLPQLRELICEYEPEALFTDGEWMLTSDKWRSEEFLQWLFNESSVRDTIVINDRWGGDTRSRHGGYYTSEYGEVTEGVVLDLNNHHKWEECRGISNSFGYNRNEELSDYLGARELIHMFIDIVSRGGNLCLNIGPSADGRIPVIMEERLRQLGEFLRVNGEAIYSTKPHRIYSESDVRYTARDGKIYAIILGWPGRERVLKGVAPASGAVTARLLGVNAAVGASICDGGVKLKFPELNPFDLSTIDAFAVELTGVV